MFKKKDLLSGLLIIIVLIFGVYIYSKKNKEDIAKTDIPVDVTYKKDFEDSFNISFPSNEKLIELKDVSGGSSRGIASENEILIDAPDPVNGSFYEAWLQEGDNFKSLGKLKQEKGGWIINYSNVNNIENVGILVSLEKVFDKSIEKKILEGSF